MHQVNVNSVECSLAAPTDGLRVESGGAFKAQSVNRSDLLGQSQVSRRTHVLKESGVRSRSVNTTGDTE